MTYAAQLKRLAGFNDEARAVAMIDHTIAQGWKGLRELDDIGAAHKKPTIARPLTSEEIKNFRWEDHK